MKEIIGLRQIGVWIDSHKAVIISINEDESSIENILSDIETRERVDGETRSNARFGDQHIDSEKNRESRLSEQRRTFLSKIIEKIKDADEMVFFGPAEMKHHLEKQSGFKHKISAVVRADSMTENQMVAWARNYFENK